MRRAGVLSALWLAVLTSHAAAQTQQAEPQRIVDIVFEGNDTTQPRVMLREIVVKPGDLADGEQLEASRQAVLDLGLFKEVTARAEPVEGGVRWVFSVRERYYVLPTPIFDAKSDGRYRYGAQLRWSNLWGLNHALRLVWDQENQQKEGIGKDTQWSAGYYAPFVADSPYHLGFAADYTTQPVNGDGGLYEEQFRSAVASISRTYSDGPASQGWTLGGGVRWQQQRTTGVFAPPAYGEATAPLLFVNHRDFHNRVYSEVGSSYGASYELADDSWSDYNYSSLNLGAIRYLQVGDTAHQTLHLIATSGLYFNGPDGEEHYSLGGANRLRGYELDFMEGNAYWYGAVEFARPVWQRWLRAVVILEAGSVAARPEDLNGDVHASLGFGLRLRFSNFINFQVEAGVAIPLDGGGARFFAGGV